MFHAETKILSLPPKGSTGRNATAGVTTGSAGSGTSGSRCVQIVLVHFDK